MQKSFFSIFLVLGAFTCGLASAHADTTAPTVSYTFDNQTLTVTPTGSTTINVSAGSSFAVTGSWSSLYNGSGDHDLIQTYLAGLYPLAGQVDLFDPESQGSDPGNFDSSGSGIYSGTFTAPKVAGTYYIGGGQTADYQFDSGVSGVPNGLNQVSYIVNVAGAQTPEPSSLILLGSGLLGMVVTSRRRASEGTGAAASH